MLLEELDPTHNRRVDKDESIFEAWVHPGHEEETYNCFPCSLPYTTDDEGFECG